MNARLGFLFLSVFALAGAATFVACGEAVTYQPGACTAVCDDRECGSDGCGGICGVCADTEVCTAKAQCVVREACVPDCSLRDCGSDDCEGSCGVCLGSTPFCNLAIRRCVDCLPSCTNRVCGGDGCGGICGQCEPGGRCDEVSGTCCTPVCAGRECGDDQCGGVCGTCTGTVANACTDEGTCP